VVIVDLVVVVCFAGNVRGSSGSGYSYPGVVVFVAVVVMVVVVVVVVVEELEGNVSGFSGSG
jgi:hypothetical protein